MEAAESSQWIIHQNLTYRVFLGNTSSNTRRLTLLPITTAVFASSDRQSTDHQQTEEEQQRSSTSSGDLPSTCRLVSHIGSCSQKAGW